MRMEPSRPTCSVSDCTKHPTGRNSLCPQHLHIDATRGHPNQSPVFPYLRPYIQRVTMWSKEPEGKKALEAAVAQYIKQTDHYRSVTADNHELTYRTGVMNTSVNARMGELITGVSAAKDARKTLVQLIAFGLLWNEDPSSLKNDTAALCEVTNVYMRGSQAHSTRTFDSVRNRVRVTTKYLKRPVRLALGQWLMTHWVVLGITLSREWNRRLALELREKRELTDLIKASA